MTDPVIALIPFTDGIDREVFEDGTGQQYVFGPDGERVYDLWVLPLEEADVPHVVESEWTTST